MATDPRVLFGDRVRRLREAAELSRDVAAERGGISSNFWGEVERAEKVPSFETILGIAKGLQISPSSLFTDKEEDPNLLKKTQQLVEKATPEQLTLLHRIAKVIVG
jgi:transcriptional regulator with XRE-family HTH domain